MGRDDGVKRFGQFGLIYNHRVRVGSRVASEGRCTYMEVFQISAFLADMHSPIDGRNQILHGRRHIDETIEKLRHARKASHVA